MLTFNILTILPGMFTALTDESIVKRAQDKKKVSIKVHDLRAFTKDKHLKVDDRPFGGGPGMVLTAQPIFDAVKKACRGRTKAKVILTTPSGTTFTQKTARRLAKEKNLIIICGHYEGIDERVRLKLR